MKPIAILTVLSAVALASCQGTREVRELPQSRQMAPVGVQGAWVDPNGVVSTFAGGTFSTRTTDTNQEIASGTYTNLTCTSSPGGYFRIDMTRPYANALYSHILSAHLQKKPLGVRLSDNISTCTVVYVYSTN